MKTTGERLGLRCNRYYITLRDKEEMKRAKTMLEHCKVLQIKDFYFRKCPEGYLLISKHKAGSLKGKPYIEWRRMVQKIRAERRKH